MPAAPDLNEVDRKAAHTAAAKVKLLPLLGDDYPVSTPDDVTPVDKDAAPLYLELVATRTFGGVRYGDGTAGSSLWRLSARSVADTRADANMLLDRADQALDGAVLDVAGVASTPLIFDTESDVDVDAGKYSGLKAWTYYFD